MKKRLFFLAVLLSLSIFTYGQLARLSVQKGHTAEIATVAYSADGSMIASADKLGKIVLWDVMAAQQMDEYYTKSEVSVLVFSPDNRLLCAGSTDGSVNAFDIPKSTLVFTDKLPGKISCAYFTDNSNCYIGAQGLYHCLPDRNETKRISEEEMIYIGQGQHSDSLILITVFGKVFSAALSNPWELISNAASCKEITKKYYRRKAYYVSRLKWNGYLFSSKERVERNYKRFSDRWKIQCLDYCRDNNTVVYGINHLLTIKSLGAKGKPKVVSSPYFDETFTSCAIDLLNDNVLAPNMDYKIYQYSLKNGAYKGSLKNHLAEVNALRFSPDRKYFVSASSDRSLIIWDAGSKTPVKLLYSRVFNVTAIALNGYRFYFTDEIGSLKSMKVDSSFINIRTILRHEGPLFDVAIINDSTLVSSGMNSVIFSNNVNDHKKKELSFYVEVSGANVLQRLYYLLLGTNKDNEYKVGNVETVRNTEFVIAAGNLENTFASFIKMYRRHSGTYRAYRSLHFNVNNNLNRKLKLEEGNSINYLQCGGQVVQDSNFYTVRYDQIINWKIIGRNLYYKTIKLDNPCTGNFKMTGKDTMIYLSGETLHIKDLRSGKEFDRINGCSNVFDVYNNSVYCYYKGQLFAYNLRTRKLNLFVENLQEITLVKVWDNNRLVTSGTDGAISIWNIATGGLIITIFPIDDEKVVMITGDNYYYASKNSLGALGYKVGGDFYSFEQFDLQYNRPDIVLERMGFADTLMISAYRNAYNKRLKKMKFTETMFSSDFHMPVISLLDADKIGMKTNNAQFTFTIKAIDSKYNLNRINVFVNDVPAFGMDGIDLSADNTDSIVKSLSLELAAGDNKIQMSCFNEKGVESLKASTSIRYEPIEPVRSKRYLVAISVSEYKDARFNLKYAAKDGRDMARLFAGKNAIVDTLFNKNATRVNILALKQKLMQTKVDDEVILYVSGHGLLDENFDFYFATYDMNFSKPAENGILYDDLEALLDGIPARKKLLLMDACHSGEVDKDDIEVKDTGQVLAYGQKGEVKTYGYKGIVLDTAENMEKLGLKNSFELMQELFANLSRGTGAVVISAAAGTGYALESPKWNNGVFTFCILNGLKNLAADANGDKSVTVTELKDYVSREVERLTKGAQRPTSRRESLDFDWKVW